MARQDSNEGFGPALRLLLLRQALPKRPLPTREAASLTSLQVCKAAGQQRLELLNDGLHAQHALPGPPVRAQAVNGRALAELRCYLRQQRQRKQTAVGGVAARGEQGLANICMYALQQTGSKAEA